MVRTMRRYAYDYVCQHLQEEGGEEYASYHKGSREGHTEAHVEGGVLYQPLSPADEGGREGFWLISQMGGQGESGPNAERGGSRCSQYGGHWHGHECVIKGRARGGHITARDVVCTIVGAAGGAVLDVPGALIAGGACIVIWR